MNKMKRIFSFVLALAMLVGGLASVVAPAYAAEVEDKEVTKILKEVPKDIIGTEHEKAVRRLVAFGIVGGYPDGTYKPEENVTRSQFAKIIVEALGLADAVPAAQGKKTGFADVDQYVHWASGYISVAAGEGLIKGYEDGLFRPEQPVSYAEALTMLVRALGYQDNFLAGQWPGNYVAKAASVGITRGVKIPSDAGVTATRGYVADLVNNTLDAKVVKVNKYNPTIGQIEYEETDVTLLKDKLEISKHEDTRIFADKLVDDGLRKNEVEVRFLEDTRKPEEVRVTYKENDKKTFESEFNARPFIGEESTIYLTEKDVLVYVERENDDKANFDYVEEIDKDKVALVAFDKSYDFDKDADVYVFDSKDDEFKYMTGDDVKSADKDEMLGKVGKFVVRNNKIVYAEVYDSTEASPWMLVLKNDKGQLEGINQQTEDFKLDLRKDRNYDYVIAHDTEGNEVDVEDIEKGNLIYAQFQDYDGDDVAVVTVVKNNVVTGKLGKYRTDRVEIGGKTYKAIRYKEDGNKFQAYYTVNDLEEIEEWEETEAFQNDMDDAYGEEVTAYLDATGKIAFLTTDVEAVSGYKFGVVTRTYADGDRVRIFTSLDGKEAKDQIFKADKERNITNPRLIEYKGSDFEVEPKDKTEARNVLGAAVKFRLNKDGEIDEDEFYMMDRKSMFRMSDDFGKDTMRVIGVTDIKDNDKINGSRKSFAISNSVDMIDAEKLDPTKSVFDTDRGDIENLDTSIDIDDFDLVKWEDMKEDNKDEDLRFYVFPKNNRRDEVEGVVFVGAKGANTGSDEVAVYVIKKDRKSDEVEVQYDEYGKGKESKIVDGAKYLGDVDKEKAYVAKHKSNGKIELLKDNAKMDDFTIYRGAKVLSTGSEFKVEYKGETHSFVYRNNPVTYSEDKVKDAKVGNYVDLIVEDDVRIRVVGIVDEKSTSKPEETTKGVVTYINKSGNIEIDRNKYKLNEDSVLYDTNGKTTLAIGKLAIYNALTDEDSLKADYIVKNIKIDKDNYIIEMTKDTTETAKEAAAKTAVAAAKEAVAAAKTAVENENFDATAAKTEVTAAKEAVAAAEKAVNALKSGDLKTEKTKELAEAKKELKAIEEKLAEKLAETEEEENLEAAKTAVAAAEKAVLANEEKIVEAEKLVVEAKKAVAKVTDKVKKAKLEADLLVAEKKVEAARLELDAAIENVNNSKDKYDLMEAVNEKNTILGLEKIDVNVADYVLTKMPQGGYKTAADIAKAIEAAPAK